MKNENADFAAYATPPVEFRWVKFGQSDANHYPEAGEKLFVVTRECLGSPSRRGFRGTVTNTGVAPAFVERSRYAENAVRYRDGFQFLPGEAVTESILVGNRNTSSDEGRARLAGLIDDMKILPVGRCVPGGAGWLSFEYSPEGVDHLFDVDRFAESRVIRRMDGPGSAPLKDGPLYILARDGYFGNCRPSPAPAGYLLPSSVLADPAVVPESAMPAGEIVDRRLILNDNAREYLRAAAIIEADLYARADGRGNPARMSEGQAAFLDAKLAACAAEVAEVTA